jgi:NADH-quinone oxidoreductase subunit G
MFGSLIATAPGSEAHALKALAAGTDRTAELLRQPGAVILVGERLATVTGAYSAAIELAKETGARLGWVPRRAGDRGAVDAGLLPGLLPGGRELRDSVARADVATVWGINVDELPVESGREIDAIIDAAAQGAYDAVVVAGVDPYDTRRPAAFFDAFDAVPFVISLEAHGRPNVLSDQADVVFPVATVTEKAGTFVDWEGRSRAFGSVFRDPLALTDARVLAMIADEMDLNFGRQDVADLRREIAVLEKSSTSRRGVPTVAASAPTGAADEVVLATWHHLIDLGSLQEGETDLLATGRTAVARMSAGTAAKAGLDADGFVMVRGDVGSIELPVAITDMPDGVVWVPTNSQYSTIRRLLGADHGSTVTLAPGGKA